MNKLYDDTYLDQLQTFFNKTKDRSFELLKPQDYETIVDVGCGTGNDALNLSQKSNAKIIGIDHDFNFIALAIAKNTTQKVEFICCEANQIPLSSYSIDKVRFDRVFQHISNQNEVLLEVSRILKPQGTIQIIDTDYLGFNLFLSNKNLESKIINTIAFNRIPNGHTTRSLPETLTKNGFNLTVNEIHNYQINDADFANFIIRFDKIVNEEFHLGKISNDELMDWQTDRQNFKLSLDLLIYQANKI